MKKIAVLLVIALIFIATRNPALGSETLNSDVSASVPSANFYGPNLISPPNNHATNSARTTFIWKRPSPLPDSSTLHHYDLFIDDTIFASNIPDSLTSQDFYFYTASASSGTFYISLKQDQSQGYHTWRVAVYDDLGQNTATSNWTYYIDSISPFISLDKIDTKEYNWNTSISGSIPEETERYLNVNSKNPKLTGKVETNANFQFSLICPTSAPTSCTNQSWISNSSDGNWEKQLSNLISNVTYSVILSATDATNNSTTFPTFYLTYKTQSSSTITATATPTTPLSTSTPTPTSPFSSPTQTPLPTTSIKLTPPPDLGAQITPTPFISKTPPAPTIPPKRQQAAVVESDILKTLIYILLVLGLPTHLIITGYSLGIKVKNLFKFLLVLGFPFLRSGNSRTSPFIQITLHDPNKLQKPVYSAISDINGYYNTPQALPNQLLVTIQSVTKDWKDQIISKNILLSSCLYPHNKKILNTSNKTKIFLYNKIKIIPLIIAILTSSIGIIYTKDISIGVYFYLSVQYCYSEYLYKK